RPLSLLRRDVRVPRARSTCCSRRGGRDRQVGGVPAGGPGAAPRAGGPRPTRARGRPHRCGPRTPRRPPGGRPPRPARPRRGARAGRWRWGGGGGGRGMEGVGCEAQDEHDLRMDWSFDGEEFEEESKLRDETRKILELPKLPIQATCVRVPVMVGHAEAVWIEL